METAKICESTSKSSFTTNQSSSSARNRIQTTLKFNNDSKHEPIDRRAMIVKKNYETRRMRGRPRVTEPSTIPQQALEICSKDELRYLEARCKNNEASRRSRLKQKEKANVIFDLLKVEEKRHEALKKIDTELNKKIQQLKKKLIEYNKKRLK